MPAAGLFYHVTTDDRMASIREHGLLTKFSSDRGSPCIWMIADDCIDWAVQHVMAREGGGAYYYVLQLRPDPAPERAYYGAFSKIKVFYTAFDIPPAQITAEIELGWYVCPTTVYSLAERRYKTIGDYWYTRAEAKGAKTASANGAGMPADAVRIASVMPEPAEW